MGESGKRVYIVAGHAPLLIKANGRQSRLMYGFDRYGFPRNSPKRGGMQFGFQTGDIVKAVVPTGKKQGIYIGHVAVRSSGNFNVTTSVGTVQGISYRSCASLHDADGYSYEKGEAFFPIA